MNDTLAKLSQLKVDRAKGIAPHKPLLLLSLCDLAEEGLLTQELMPVTGELGFRFANYWSVVAYRRSQRPDLKLPLYHMKSDGFWLPLDQHHQALKHRELPAYLQLDPEFLATINDPASRSKARAILIRQYFESSEAVALWSLLGCKVTAEMYEDVAIEKAAVERGREGRFRMSVIGAYNYTCALTGYRLVTLTSGTIVDACHIHQFAASRNNDVNNGIALSKNAHWLFDNGLWSLRDDYTVVVADRHFAELGEAAMLLSNMKDRKINLPANPANWPAQRHLQWHRQSRFLG